MKSLKETLLDRDYEVPDKSIALGDKNIKALYDVDWKQRKAIPSNYPIIMATFAVHDWKDLRDYIMDQKCSRSPYKMYVYKSEDEHWNYYCATIGIIDSKQNCIYQLQLVGAPNFSIQIDKPDKMSLKQFNSMFEPIGGGPSPTPTTFPVNELFVSVLDFIWSEKYKG